MKFSERAVNLYHCIEYCKKGCSPRCPRSSRCEQNNVCRGNLLADIQDYLDEIIDYFEEEDM